MQWQRSLRSCTTLVYSRTDAESDGLSTMTSPLSCAHLPSNPDQHSTIGKMGALFGRSKPKPESHQITEQDRAVLVS